MKARRMDGSEGVDCIVPYRESPTWQGLAVTSRSFASLPVVGSSSWVHPLYAEGDYLSIHRGTAFAQSARYPVWPQSEGVKLCRISKTNKRFGFEDLKRVSVYPLGSFLDRSGR